MAKLTYNGVSLEISDTQSVIREDMYSEDGQTYLYTRWLFQVACIYNPNATSSLAGVAMPAATDVAIRNALSLPRKTLTYVDEAGATILTSPAAGFPCDSRGGPYVRVNQIRKIWGSRSWLVVFAVETFINEGNTSVILSNRWDMSADIDVDHYATRTIRGVAVFDKGQLDKVGKAADQFRKDLFHPVPINFRRENVQVYTASDGCTVYYTVIDKEQPVNLLFNNPTRFEAYHTEWSSRPSFWDTGFQLQMRNVNKAFSVGRNIANRPKHGLEALAGGLTDLAQDAINTAASMLPQYYTHCIVRAWGDRLSRRKNLTDFCMNIAFNRLNIASVLTLNNFAGVETSVTHALHAKYVEVQGTVKHGPNPVTLLKMWNKGQDFPPEDNVGGPDGIALAQSADANGQTLPNSGGTRGTWLGKVVAAALESQGQVPPQPVNEENVDQTFR